MPIPRYIDTDDLIDSVCDKKAKKRLLTSILEQSVKPEAIQEILRLFHVEKTLAIDDPCKIASWANYRVDEIDHQNYILCPVPFLHDPKTGIEVGFAIDVDVDSFMVYPYLHDEARKRSIVLDNLPHCVHAAIVMDARDYSLLNSEAVEMSNEASAIFFITNLINDIAVGLDSPVEFFDNRLYLQLLLRLTGQRITGWETRRLAALRFKHLVRQYQELDTTSDMYENNVQRVLLYMDLFLFGDLEVNFGGSFLSRANVADLQAMSPVLHRMWIKQYRAYEQDKNPEYPPFKKNQLLARRARVKPPEDVIHDMYEIILSMAHETDSELLLQDLKEAFLWTGETPSREQVQKVFFRLVAAKKFTTIEQLSNWTSLIPTTKIAKLWYKVILESIFPSEQDLSNELNRICKVTNVAFDDHLIEDLHKIDDYWNPGWQSIHPSIERRFAKLKVTAMIAMLEKLANTRIGKDKHWTAAVASLTDGVFYRMGLDMTVDLDMFDKKALASRAKDVFGELFARGDIAGMVKWHQWIGAEPDRKGIDAMINQKPAVAWMESLIMKGDWDGARFLMWLPTDPMILPASMVNRCFFEFFMKLDFANVELLEEFSWQKYTPETIQNVYESLLDANDVHKFWEIYRYSKLLPVLTDMSLSLVFNGLLQDRAFNAIEKLHEVVKKVPRLDQGVVQGAFKWLLARQDFSRATQMAKILGTRWSNDSVQAIYKNLLKAGNMMAIALVHSYTMVAVDIPEDVLKEGFEILLGERRFDDARVLCELTGSPVVVDDNFIDGLQIQLLGALDLSTSRKLSSLTGKPLTEKVIATMQEWFSGTKNARAIATLEEFTGKHMAPIDDDAQSYIDREIIMSTIDAIADGNDDITTRTRFYQTNLLQWIKA